MKITYTGIGAIIGLLIGYLAGSFSEASFDIKTWSAAMRFSTVIMMVVSAFICILIVETLESVD